MLIEQHPDGNDKAVVTLTSMQDHYDLFDNASFFVGRFAIIRDVTNIFRVRQYEFPEVVTMSFDELRSLGNNALRLSKKWNKPGDTCTDTKKEVADKIANFLEPVELEVPRLELVA